MSTSSIEAKRSLVALVERFPGLHLRELARHANMSEALATYHLESLVTNETLRSVTDGSFRRFYPNDATAPSRADEELLALLRRPVPLQVSVLLLESGPKGHQAITESLGLAKSTVSYHLDHMTGAGLVVRDDSTAEYRLAAPQKVERLLVRWRPPRDLTDRFAALWGAFYQRTRKERR